MKQHFALTLHQNPTNWTGRDSVVTMCLPWMPDHISLAHALITARMNGFVTTVKFHENNDHVAITASVYFLSCYIQICPKWKLPGKNAVFGDLQFFPIRLLHFVAEVQCITKTCSKTHFYVYISRHVFLFSV